eukprot:g188.t1
MEAPIPLTRHSEALRDLALQLQAPSEEMQGEMEDLAQRLTEATEAFAAAKRKLRQLQRAKAQKKDRTGRADGQVGRNAQVAARIIGFVREVRTSDARPEMEMDPMPLTGTEVPELANDRCILNDEGLTLLCGAKVLCSLSLPLVQLCVIVAAQVYLGRQSGFELWPFAATFEEARRSLFRLGPWNAMGFICQGGWADARQKTIAQRRGLEAAPGNLSTVSAGSRQSMAMSQDMKGEELSSALSQLSAPGVQELLTALAVAGVPANSVRCMSERDVLGTALVVLPQSCLAAPNTVRTAPDVARSLWGKGLRSDEDLARWEAAVASDCVYEDLYYAEPAKGKQAVVELIRQKLLPPKSHLVIDSLSDGSSSCGFTWHIEEDGVGIGHRGLCFVRLNSAGEVAYVRDLGEPLFKAGELTEKLLEALTKDQPLPERPVLSGPPQTPRMAGSIVKYLYGDVQKSGGDAVRFYAEDVVYEDMNYEVPFVGKKAVDGFLARFQNIQGVTFNLEEVSDGEEAVGFTYTIQIAGQPRGIRGITFYKVKDGKEKNQARIEADRIDREFKRKDLQQRCGELFDELDVHHNRVLPRDEIRQVTEQVALLLESFGVNFQRADLDQMFYVMDYSDTGIIERSEFI